MARVTHKENTSIQIFPQVLTPVPVGVYLRSDAATVIQQKLIFLSSWYWSHYVICVSVVMVAYFGWDTKPAFLEN